MVTRRTDARRRRVLSEEFVPTDQSVGGSDSARPMDPYSYGANRRNQPKTTDLIPKRIRAVGFFLLVVFSCVGLLNLLACYAAPIGQVIGLEGARALELSGSGTLANWFCCGCLFLSAAICLQLFKLRQHKRDDYGGMYRVWILMACLFLIASLDCAVDLRTMAARTFEHFTHRSLIGTPWLWMTIEMIVLGLFVLRMLFEMRISTVSLVSVTVVWLAFVGCIVMRNVGLPEQVNFLDATVAYGNAVLIGCAGVLVSLTIYARFVYLHAHGFITVKVAVAEPAVAFFESEPEVKTMKPVVVTSTNSKKTATKAESTATPEPVVVKDKSATKKTSTTKTTKTTSASSSSTSKKSTSKKKSAVVDEPQAIEEDADDESGSILKMSKAERRRQRKLARRAAKKAA